MKRIQPLALWLTGRRVENSWAHANEEASVYELKGICSYVCALGIALGNSW